MASMPPPPPRPPKSSLSISNDPSVAAVSSTSDVGFNCSTPSSIHEEETDSTTFDESRAADVLYSVPPWSAAPAYPFSLEVIKDGQIIENLSVSAKGAFMFGRSDRCDFILEHPSISRYHAVLQFKRAGDAFIFDLGSTHGTFINKRKVMGKVHAPLYVGDIFRFGLSTRLYVLQGPAELMPKESQKMDKQLLQEANAASDELDREASLMRAKRDAIQMEGATWGMLEDAVEQEIQQEDEITWQTYTGQLTEKQQKTLEKIQKRNGKISSLRREIDAIQVKEVRQGGLTQGQQIQVARNEQRIEQLMEEVENLEETLNQSIQESIGACVRKSLQRGEDEDDVPSDDDDFYDRTNRQKKKDSRTTATPQVVETAVSLLQKREKLMEEIRVLNVSLEKEMCEFTNEDSSLESQEKDALDAFMTSVSSTLGKDRVHMIKKEIEMQQAELDRVIFLLKVADPTGEAVHKWHRELETTNQLQHVKTPIRVGENEDPVKLAESVEHMDKTVAIPVSCKQDDAGNKLEPTEWDADARKNGDVKQISVKGPILLGQQPNEMIVEAKKLEEVGINSNDFLEYHERHKLDSRKPNDTIPEDAEGLILRKPKSMRVTGDDMNEQAIWDKAAAAAADKVALLLRHQRGLGALEDDEMQYQTAHVERDESPKTSKKRKLGPDRPAFLDVEESDLQSWIPPKGQTGDGRTALNEKYGY